jgi:hypothetical protein
MFRGLHFTALLAVSTSGALAFTPNVRVRASAPGLVSGSRGPLVPPFPTAPSARANAGATTADAALAVSENPLNIASKYDDTAFFENFMTSVISRVDEREEMEVSRSQEKRRSVAKVMDTLVTLAACLMAMQLWGVWMALGVWAARRAELLLQTASDAQSLVVAFATGSPLDSVSRKTVLTNPRKAKWQRRANELLEESNQQPALLTTAVTIPMHEPEAPMKPALNEKELREIAASKARAELWELSRDLAIIARYNARKAAEAGAKKVMRAYFPPPYYSLNMAAQRLEA